MMKQLEEFYKYLKFLEPFLLLVIFTDSTAVSDKYIHTPTHCRGLISSIFSSTLHRNINDSNNNILCSKSFNGHISVFFWSHLVNLSLSGI